MRGIFTVAGVAVVFLLGAGDARADNTTSVMAYSLMIGGTAAEAFFDNVSTERWYYANPVAGRSYCVETQGGVHFDTSPTAGRTESVLTVLAHDATTVIGTALGTSHEPKGSQSRVCWQDTDGVFKFIKVTPVHTYRFNFRVRIVETTLFSNWFFVGGDYSAYTLLRNTTDSLVTYTMTWRDSAGTVLDTATGTLPGNGSTYINARNYPAVVSAVSGTVDIAHNRSPGAIVASTTVLSPATGLSFDAPFAGIMGRQPW